MLQSIIITVKPLLLSSLSGPANTIDWQISNQKTESHFTVGWYPLTPVISDPAAYLEAVMISDLIPADMTAQCLLSLPVPSLEGRG